MHVTFDIPEDLAMRLGQVQNHIPQILELGLREFGATGQPDFEGAGEVLELLARLPEPETILALRPSPKLQSRIRNLLEKAHNRGLSEDEEREWQQYEYLEHLVRMAKARALSKLKAS